MRRLVYAKGLFLHGHNHVVNGTELDRMIAIHNFDNSVELLIKCIPTFFQESISREDERVFERLWAVTDEILTRKSAQPLPMKQDMLRLHDARNSAQHYGTIPSPQDLQRYDIYGEDFLKAVLSTIFGIDYANLSMSLMISNQRIQPVLAESEKLLANGDYQGSMKATARAFAIARFVSRTDKGLGRFGRFTTWGIMQDMRIEVPRVSLFSRDLPENVSRQVEYMVNEATKKTVESVQDTLNRQLERSLNDFARALGEEIEVLRLGVDYTMLSRFERISPRTFFVMASDEPKLIEAEASNYNKENAAFCYMFALETILKWQESGAIK